MAIAREEMEVSSVGILEMVVYQGPLFNCLCIRFYRIITIDSRVSFVLNLYLYLLGRDPLLILNTSAYHFCKFSLVKKPKISLKEAESHPKNCDEKYAGETCDDQYKDDSEGSVEDSSLLQGIFYLSCLDHKLFSRFLFFFFSLICVRFTKNLTITDGDHAEGTTYVAVAGEQPTEVTRNPQNCFSRFFFFWFSVSCFHFF